MIYDAGEINMKYDYSNGSRLRLIRNALHFGSLVSIGRGQEITELMHIFILCGFEIERREKIA